MNARNAKRNNSVRRTGGLRNIARPTPIGIVSAVAAASVVTITFNQPVSLKGIPQYPNNTGQMPTSAVLTTPTVLSLTYPLGPEATGITIPAEDAAIRNASGGFVSPTSVTV
jgi:hypothetical protein